MQIVTAFVPAVVDAFEELLYNNMSTYVESSRVYFFLNNKGDAVALFFVLTENENSSKVGLIRIFKFQSITNALQYYSLN